MAGAGSGSIVAGAVRARTVTATHMAAKANEPTASRATSAVKVSPKIHTLNAMLTMGSTMTMNGCETLSGPTWRAA